MSGQASVSLSAVMPRPAAIKFGSARLAVTAAWKVCLVGVDDQRLRAGLARSLRRIEERTGLAFARAANADYSLPAIGTAAALVIECRSPGRAIPVLGEDEAYTLETNSTQATLRAQTVLGAELRSRTSRDDVVERHSQVAP